MNWNYYKKQWLAEEAIAHIHGWDFSHINDRYSEEDDLPWDYRTEVLSHLEPDSLLLDQDTGGGEFLLSLSHPHHLTAATEGFPPNVALCREALSPLGVDFRAADAARTMPFEDGSFDLVINRHGSYNVSELSRILRPGGRFVTQQVGEQNDRELVELLLPGTPIPYPGWDLAHCTTALEGAGFRVLKAKEAFRPIVFRDVGALVWFARIIEWEFPGFSVEGCFEQLKQSQRLIDTTGRIEGRIHRFFIAAEKLP